jgi:VIT1/CCC1 family predicted Fe2+/Mn2+ transporter
MSIVGDAVSGLAVPLFSLVDKLFTSDEERAEAKRKLIELEQSGELETMKASLSAIIAEAQSADPWTSRARPTFLYVIYLLILAALPMGLVAAFKPEVAQAVAAGVQAWLGAIPGDLWYLFGAGYLGYSASRSFDKWRGQGGGR